MIKAYKNGQAVWFELVDGKLVDEEGNEYNDEYYTEDDFSLIRVMLLNDGYAIEDF